MKRDFCRLLFPLLALLLCATTAFPQSQITGNIAGRAQDSSGALIPGVEVSVTSPAMIGGARTAVTDETGSYRFTLLPAGTYRVTFSLVGFKTLNIESVVVTPQATMTINGTMEVATVAEEVTVTSQAPAIDLEAATVGVNWDIHKLDELPYSRSLVALNSMVPGVFFTGTLDVGGSQFGTSSAVSGRTYGRSGNNVMAIDGLVWCQGYADYGSFEEINFTTASKGADQANAGLTMQMIVKSGTNQFHGNFTTTYERGSFQAQNIDQALLNRGFAASSNKFVQNRNFYGDIGGPIIKDKLTFYFAYTDGELKQLVPGFIEFKTGEPATFVSKIQNPTTKLTYQLNSKMKIETSWPLDLKTQPYRNGNKYIPLEATQNQHSWATYGPNLTWTDIISSKMTATAKINRGGYWWPDDPWSGAPTNSLATSTAIPTIANANDVRRIDATTSAALGPQLSIYRRPIRWTWTGDVSRFQAIGGKNNEIKIGYTGWWTKSYTTNFGYPNQQIYRYQSLASEDFTDTTPAGLVGLFQHPNRVDIIDYPNTTITAFGYKALYFNDKINLSRKLTVTAGLRMDYYNSWLPAQGRKGLGPASILPDGKNSPPAPDFTTPFLYPNVPASEFPTYTRFVPRLSFAYDVTGEGKLAFKASYGRYTAYSSGIGSPLPSSSTVNPNATTTCTYMGWTGAGGIPFVPTAGNYTSVSCTGGGGGAGLLDPSKPSTWPNKLSKDLDSDYLDEYTAGVDVGFNRNTTLRINVVRKYEYNRTKQLDIAQPYEAWSDKQCATYDAATNKVTNLPLGQGTPSGDANSGVACVWSVPRSYPTQGKVDTLVVNRRPGEGTAQYTAYEFTFNKQNSNGWSFLGSYNVSMFHTNANDPINPNEAAYHSTTATGSTTPTFFGPTSWDQAVKMSGTYQLPWGFQWSSTFGMQSGQWMNRAVQIRNALGTNVNQVIAFQVDRYPWVNVWDQRFAKKFKVREGHSVEAFIELFNSLNANTVTSAGSNQSNPAIGPASFLGKDGSFYRPTEIVSPRILQLTAKYRF